MKRNLLKLKTFALIATASLLTFTSCTKDEIADYTEEQMPEIGGDAAVTTGDAATFVGGFNTDSKVAFDGLKASWEDGDEIGISGAPSAGTLVNEQGVNCVYNYARPARATISTGIGGKHATFTLNPTSAASFVKANNAVYIITYPYKPKLYIASPSYTYCPFSYSFYIADTVPRYQYAEYVSPGKVKRPYICAAASTTKTASNVATPFNLKYQTSYFRFNISRDTDELTKRFYDGAIVDSVVLTNNNGSVTNDGYLNLSGYFYHTSPTSGPGDAAVGLHVNGTTQATLSFVKIPESERTLNSDDDLDLGKFLLSTHSTPGYKQYWKIKVDVYLHDSDNVKLQYTKTIDLTANGAQRGTLYTVNLKCKKLVRMLDLSSGYRVFSSSAAAYNATSGQLLFCPSSSTQKSVNADFAEQVPINYEIISKAVQPNTLSAAELNSYDIIAMCWDTEYYLTSAGATTLQTWLAGAPNRVLLLPTIGYAERYNTGQHLVDRFFPNSGVNATGAIPLPVPWGALNMVSDTQYKRAWGYPSQSAAKLAQYGIIGPKNPILAAHPSWTFDANDMVAFLTDDDAVGFTVTSDSPFTPVTFSCESTAGAERYGLLIDFDRKILVGMDSDMWGGSNSDYYSGSDYFGMPRRFNNNVNFGSNPSSTNCRAAYCYTPFYADPYGSDIADHTGETNCSDCSVKFIRACRTGRIMLSGVWAWVLKTAAKEEI